jgi:hypothetical protein
VKANANIECCWGKSGKDFLFKIAFEGNRMGEMELLDPIVTEGS